VPCIAGRMRVVDAGSKAAEAAGVGEGGAGAYSMCDCPIDRHVPRERHCADIRSFTCSLAFAPPEPAPQQGTAEGSGRDAVGKVVGASPCKHNFEEYDYRADVDGDPPCNILRKATQTSGHDMRENSAGIGEAEGSSVAPGAEKAEGGGAWEFASWVSCMFDDWAGSSAGGGGKSGSAGGGGKSSGEEVGHEHDGFRYSVYKADMSFASGYGFELALDIKCINFVRRSRSALLLGALPPNQISQPTSLPSSLPPHSLPLARALRISLRSRARLCVYICVCARACVRVLFGYRLLLTSQ